MQNQSTRIYISRREQASRRGRRLRSLVSVPAVRRASPPGHASLGKQTLCQLSYSRSERLVRRQTCILAMVRPAINGAARRRRRRSVLDGSARQIVALSVKPSSIVRQDNGTSAVLVSSNALYAFTIPREARVTPTPVPSSPIPTPGALSPTPAVTGVGATPPAATPVPTGSAVPGPTRTRPPAFAVSAWRPP